MPLLRFVIQLLPYLLAAAGVLLPLAFGVRVGPSGGSGAIFNLADAVLAGAIGAGIGAILRRILIGK